MVAVKKRSIQWDDLQTFAAVHRTGSNSAAARELGITHATVGRRLRELTAAAGSALFERDETGSCSPPRGARCWRRRRRWTARPQPPAAALGHHRARPGARRAPRASAPSSCRVTSRRCTRATRHRAGAARRRAHASLARRRADLAIRLARPEGRISSRGTSSTSRTALLRARAAERPARRAASRAAAAHPAASTRAWPRLPESRWLDEHLPTARGGADLEQHADAGPGPARPAWARRCCR